MSSNDRMDDYYESDFYEDEYFDGEDLDLDVLYDLHELDEYDLLIMEEDE